MSSENKSLVAAKEAQEFKKKLMLVNGPFNAKQLLMILQKTPKEHIYRRKGKGGMEWDYVTGVYVKKVLNYTFGWLWDFEVKEHGREKSEEGELVWVLGRLTIRDKSGRTAIVKEQFDRADVKYKKGTKIPVDFGNDLKAASTDALKKCASELGIASDIYGSNEFKEIQKVDKGFADPTETPKPFPAQTGNPAQKINELKRMLKGANDAEKLLNLKKRTGIVLNSFDISEKHAGIVIATLLNGEVK